MGGKRHNFTKIHGDIKHIWELALRRAAPFMGTAACHAERLDRKNRVYRRLIGFLGRFEALAGTVHRVDAFYKIRKLEEYERKRNETERGPMEDSRLALKLFHLKQDAERDYGNKYGEYVDMYSDYVCRPHRDTYRAMRGRDIVRAEACNVPINNHFYDDTATVDCAGGKSSDGNGGCDGGNGNKKARCVCGWGGACEFCRSVADKDRAFYTGIMTSLPKSAEFERTIDHRLKHETQTTKFLLRAELPDKVKAEHNWLIARYYADTRHIIVPT